MTKQNLRDAINAVLEIYNIKYFKNRSEIIDISFHLKKLEKEKHI